VQGQLNGVQQQLENELSTLQHSLQRRQEVAQARRTLELLQEIAHVVSKVEKLLQEVAVVTPSSSSGSSRAAAAAGAASGGSSEVQEGAAGTDREARSRLLERVAVEASRLLYLANRGKVSIG
jgi:predicted phage gp36 major capsid-like protein